MSMIIVKKEHALKWTVDCGLDNGKLSRMGMQVMKFFGMI